MIVMKISSSQGNRAYKQYKQEKTACTRNLRLVLNTKGDIDNFDHNPLLELESPCSSISLRTPRISSPWFLSTWRVSFQEGIKTARLLNLCTYLQWCTKGRKGSLFPKSMIQSLGTANWWICPCITASVKEIIISSLFVCLPVCPSVGKAPRCPSVC